MSNSNNNSRQNTQDGAYDNNGFSYIGRDERDERAPYKRSKSRDLEAAGGGAAATANQKAHSSVPTYRDSAYDPVNQWGRISAPEGYSSSNRSHGRSGVYTISRVDSTQDPTPTESDKNGDGSSGKKGGYACIILIIILVIAILAAAAVCVYIFVFKDDPNAVATEKPVVAEDSQFEGVIVLKDEWSDDLNSKNSVRYKQFEVDVVEELDYIIEESKMSMSHTVEVTHMTPGSVQVHFYLELQDSMFTEQAVLKLLREGFTKRQGISKLNVADPLNDVRLQAVNGRPTSPFTTAAYIYTTATDDGEDVTEISTTGSTTTTSTTTASTVSWINKDPVRTTPAPVQCEYLEVQMCRDTSGYIATGFPNVFKSQTQNEAFAHLLRFLDLREKGCYDFVLEFACASLYPYCEDRKLVHPCRSFCEEFAKACNYPVACNLFPDDDDRNSCTLSPNYGGITTTVAPDTNPCSGDFFRCGNNKCVSVSRRCDGMDDCDDFTDEIKCGEASTSLDCDFETGDMCRYSNIPAGHFDWHINSGATMTYGTGPEYDHTLRTTAGKYLLAESSGRYWLDVAAVKSSLVTFDEEYCLRFYFHMFGAEVESLKVKVQRKENGVDADPTVIWQRSKQQGREWRYGAVTLQPGTFGVLFEAARGRSHLGDIAVDDITARPGKCPPRGCTQGEFMCGNGNCLQQEFVCNGKNDCGDYSDEQEDCVCTEEQWKCNMGLCIDAYNRCDKKYDCPDTSDELDCDCPLGQVRCGVNATNPSSPSPSALSKGPCIPTEWLCDREIDCDEGEDELGCTACGKDQYQCMDFGCVNAGNLCDGERHCADGSDESDCVIQQSDTIVKVRQGSDFVPLCAADFPNSLGDSVCQMLGKSHLLLIETEILQTGSYAKWSNGADPEGGLLQGLSTVSSCPGNAVVSVVCAEVTCGSRSDNVADAFIVGGTDAAAGRWPWQIGIILNGAFTCGGSVISRHHILTAAHCTSNNNVIFPASAFKITLGSIHRTSADPKRIVRNVKKISVPASYERAFYFWGSDIAILAMSEPIEFSDYIQPVCLPRPGEVLPTSSLCYVSGWGYTDYHNETVPEILQEGKMKLWSPSKCRSSYNYATDAMVCAGYNSGYISNCPGDSGGPLVCKDSHDRWKQVGVFSFMSIGCNVPMKPPVFTRVTSYLDWIKDNIECAFACDNGKCLVDSADVCNGLDDCGDMSDETRNCVPSITCKFEERYLCGYTNVPNYKKWIHQRGRVAPNTGPITDWNNGTAEGYYMYSGLNHAILLAPLYDKTKEHCLKFHYHMRSTSIGTFKVFQAPVTTNANLSSQVSLASRRTIFQQNQDLGDFWHFSKVTIPAGKFVLGFEAIGQNSPSPGVAIDDVELVEGNCDAHKCGAGYFKCIQDGLCINSRHLCNYHILCLDASDELGCASYKPYTCDLENYGLCGLEQTHVADRLDWQLMKPAAYGYFNGPLKDHTKDSKTGSFLYLNTLNGNAGERARVSIPLLDKAQEGCMQLFLNMRSNGSITVTFYTQSFYEIAWQKSRLSTGGAWQRVQLKVPNGVQQAVIDGVVGSDSNIAMSYIALDDISISQEECTRPTCTPTEFECLNGDCISSDFLCDGIADCVDESDEVHTGPNRVCECSADSFKCSNGWCLKGHVRCDVTHTLNCPDGSDELTCQNCEPGEYACRDDGTCKSKFTWCDGVEDCTDRSDEEPNCQCVEEQFQCKNRYCILGSRYCDGVVDCKDGSDEPLGCMCDDRWQFRCQNSGQCIPKSQRCDKNNDCGDYSDEVNCECQSDEFACNNKMCLPMYQYCNGEPNCPDGEDEASDCLCADDQFKCLSGGCISYNVCDAIVHCYDGSDEDQDCQCYSGEFQCATGQCLTNAYKCNGHNDCGDLSDEVNCTCRSDQWRCANSLCISSKLRCDGKDDCLDESDEQGCGCRGGEFRCSDGKCLQNEWLCDGKEDCPQGEDEAQCSQCDKTIAFECTDYSCVSILSRCDGISQCPDASDEVGCVRLSSYNGETGIMEVYKRGEFYPVCDSPLVWPTTWNDQICKMLGQGPAMTSSSTAYMSDKGYLNVVRPNGTVISSQIDQVASCSSGEVIKLTCEHRDCGLQPPPPPPPPGPSALIVGGDVAGEHRWPWMVSIYYLGVFRCGGALIGAQWVMSAAHCFIWKNGNSLVNLPHYFEVELGAAKRSSSNAFKTKISHIRMHENYTIGEEGFRYHDVALLHLIEPVPQTDQHRALCLPPVPSSAIPAPTTGYCYTAGWGFTNRDNQFAANELREAKMMVWSGERCNAEQAWGDRVRPDEQVCAGYESGYISTCYGDSGGPLMCQQWDGRWSLTGILSVGPSSCGKDQDRDTPAKPSVYARVTSYLDWIKAEVGLYR